MTLLEFDGGMEKDVGAKGYRGVSGDEARKERRREMRTHAVHVLDYRVDTGECRDVKCLGLTRNVSESGFCMYARHELQPGVTMEVSIERSRKRRATVRWCREKVEKHLYMLGLSFN